MPRRLAVDGIDNNGGQNTVTGDVHSDSSQTRDVDYVSGRTVTQNYGGVDAAVVKLFAMLIVAGIAILLIILWWASVFIVNPLLVDSRTNAHSQKAATEANTVAIASMVEQFKRQSELMTAQAERSGKITDWIEAHLKSVARSQSNFDQFLSQVRESNNQLQQTIEYERRVRLQTQAEELEKSKPNKDQETSK